LAKFVVVDGFVVPFALLATPFIVKLKFNVVDYQRNFCNGAQRNIELKQ
jgi:hypothetical protein